MPMGGLTKDHDPPCQEVLGQLVAFLKYDTLAHVVRSTNPAKYKHKLIQSCKMINLKP